MMKLARLAAEDNGTKPVLLSIPIPVISLITPITSAYYRLSRRKPLFTQFALETLESPSNFNTESSREDLGFTARPIEETIKDMVDFLRSIFRIDADSIIKNGVIKNGVPQRKKPNCRVLAAAGVLAGTALLIHSAGKRR